MFKINDYAPVFAGLAVVIMALIQYRRRKKFLNLIADGGPKLKRTEISKSKVMVPVGITVVCLLLGVFLMIKNDLFNQAGSYGLMFVIMAGVVGSNLFMIDQTYCLYYTRTGFYTNDRFINFKEIHGFDKRRGGYDVKTGKGTFPLTPAQYESLTELIKERS